MIKTTLLQKIMACVVAGLTLSALWLSIGNGGNIPWLPPVFIFSLTGITVLTALLYPFIWHYLENKKSIDTTETYGWLYALIRYGAAFNLARFGWAKLLGLQFIVPASIASQPINQLSGEWLTWYYFGHSFAFGLIVATIQIGGGLLLLFRRTVLLGAIILLAFMLNLTLINIFYRMNLGALLQSLILTIAVLYLVLLDYRKLVAFFLKATSNLPTLDWSSPLIKNMIRLTVILLPLLYSIYLKSMMP